MNLPVSELIAQLQAANPVLAEQLTAKPLLASRTPWGVLASYALGVGLARYGLALDPTTTQVVAGGFVLAGSYAMRSITRRPVA